MDTDDKYFLSFVLLLIGMFYNIQNPLLLYLEYNFLKRDIPFCFQQLIFFVVPREVFHTDKISQRVLSVNTFSICTSNLTLKVWRLRVSKTTTDDYIRCGPNQPQKNAALAIRHHCLVGWLVFGHDSSLCRQCVRTYFPFQFLGYLVCCDI